MAQRQRGQLEADILNVLWDHETPLTVKSLQDLFAAPQPAVTTLITVLERLRTKGSVERRAAGGRSFEYFASRSRLDHTNDSIKNALENAGDRHAALMLLAGTLTPKDRDVLALALSQQAQKNPKKRL